MRASASGSKATKPKTSSGSSASIYANVAPDDLTDRSDVDVYGAAVAHWNLAQVRRRGELKVHVYTPTLEEHGWESEHTVVETVVDDMPFLVDSIRWR